MSLKWFCDSCERAIADKPLSVNVTGHYDDKLDRLICVIEKLMEKYENVAAKQQQEANSRLDTIGANLEKLVDKLGIMERNLESKADRSVVTQLDSRVTGLELKLLTVETQVTAYSELKKTDENVIKEYVERAVEVKTSVDTEELEEKDKRKTSLIIHGIKESVSEESEDREEDDLGVVAAMLHELKCENVAVTKVIRLGKRPESIDGNVAKPRPIKMVVESVEQKMQIISSAKNLRMAQEGDWKTVFIHQDLTIKEREQRRKLLQELKDRKEKGETDLILVKDKIVKRSSRPQ